jgi:hypothetical protein
MVAYVLVLVVKHLLVADVSIYLFKSYEDCVNKSNELAEIYKDSSITTTCVKREIN